MNDQILKSIKGLALAKALGLAVSFAMIPEMLSLLDETKYGLWIVIFNITGWIALFDLGISNGLRNNLSIEFAKERWYIARRLVSTGYFIALIYSAVLISISLLIISVLDLSIFLKVPNYLKGEFFQLLLVMVFSSSAMFVLKMLNAVLFADHKSEVNAYIVLVSNIIILIIFKIFHSELLNNLLLVGIIYAFIPVITMMITSMGLYSKRYNRLNPFPIKWKKSLALRISNLGIKFFVLQITFIILFSTDGILISNIIGPKFVTNYSVYLKYFSSITILSNIALAPYWTAYTQQTESNNQGWIKQSLKKQMWIFVVLSLLSVSLFLLANYIIPLWTGESLTFSKSASFGIMAFTILSMWNNIFSFYLNGIGKLKVSLIVSITIALLNIPLSYFLAAHLFLGITGIIWSTNMCLMIGAITGPYQTYKIITNSAKGIWMD